MNLPRRSFLFEFGFPVAVAALVGAAACGGMAMAADAVALDGAGAPAGRTILFFGDSLTAGYGLDDPATEAWPALIGTRLKGLPGPPWKVINAGLSGETTSAGLRRVDWVLRQPADVFVLALGGNDGLRGIGAAVTKSNLEAIIKKVRAKNPKTVIVLAGMKMPVSMGSYAADFEAVFSGIAGANKALVSIPFLLEGVGGVASLNQADAIHPNAEGHRRVADHAWKTLEAVVGKVPGQD
ncbi:MAG: family lipase [Verrucomicrobiales bacterium]|nr:family lipase [Verrucomicrobiales bacterium]